MIAYIDPSSGGLLIQLLLAGLAGVGVLVKLYLKRIKAFLFSSKGNNKEP